MRSPEFPEQKDQSYFENEIDGLAKEAKSLGANRIAIMLYTVLGAIKGENEDELVEICQNFSKRMADDIVKKIRIEDRPDGFLPLIWFRATFVTINPYRKIWYSQGT
jgi:hypothetical protein